MFSLVTFGLTPLGKSWVLINLSLFKLVTASDNLSACEAIWPLEFTGKDKVLTNSFASFLAS